MNVGHENRYAYNAQAVTDARSGVIMAAEVTREETDQAQLTPMIAQVRETVGVAAQSTETLADGGYGAGAEIKAAAEQAMPVVVRPAAGGPKDNGYSSANFHYDEVAGTVTCPQKRPLDFEGSTTHDGRPVQRYRCHHQDCPVRAACTRDPRGRQIEVHPHTPAVQQMRQKLDDPQVQARLRLRSAIVEPTFARVKQHDGFRRFTVWGHQAVRAQWAMLCTVANLRIIYHAWLRRRDTPPSRGTGTSLAACAA